MRLKGRAKRFIQGAVGIVECHAVHRPTAQPAHAGCRCHSSLQRRGRHWGHAARKGRGGLPHPPSLLKSPRAMGTGGQVRRSFLVARLTVGDLFNFPPRQTRPHRKPLRQRTAWILTPGAGEGFALRANCNARALASHSRRLPNSCYRVQGPTVALYGRVSFLPHRGAEARRAVKASWGLRSMSGLWRTACIIAPRTDSNSAGRHGP